MEQPRRRRRLGAEESGGFRGKMEAATEVERGGWWREEGEFGLSERDGEVRAGSEVVVNED